MFLYNHDDHLVVKSFRFQVIVRILSEFIVMLSTQIWNLFYTKFIQCASNIYTNSSYKKYFICRILFKIHLEYFLPILFLFYKNLSSLLFFDFNIMPLQKGFWKKMFCAWKHISVLLLIYCEVKILATDFVVIPGVFYQRWKTSWTYLESSLIFK